MTQPESIEALAQAMLERHRANPAVRIADEVKALAYFRASAASRIERVDDPMVRGLLVGYERHAGPVKRSEIPG